MSLPEQVYLLTTICADRRPLFADFEVACLAARVLAESRLWRGAELMAWVLMPDHWHGLVRLEASTSLSVVMQRAKANSSREIGRTYPVSGPVWQAGFHDRALRDDDDLRVAARYVVANPIRAGLVDSLKEYPFWDSLWGEDTLAG